MPHPVIGLEPVFVGLVVFLVFPWPVSSNSLSVYGFPRFWVNPSMELGQAIGTGIEATPLAEKII